MKHIYLMLCALTCLGSYSVSHSMSNQDTKEFLHTIEAYVKVIREKGAANCISDLARLYSGTITVSENGDVLAINLKPNNGNNDPAGIRVLPYRGTALINAINTGLISLARDLIAAGAYVDETDELGISPLCYAIKTNNTSLARDLIAAGARR